MSAPIVPPIAEPQPKVSTPATVPVIAPDGTPGSVPIEQLQEAREAGFSLDTPETQAMRANLAQYGGAAGMAKAAAAGALQSIPFVGGMASKGILGDTSTEQHVNPGSDLFGSGIGIAAQSAIPGLGEIMGGGALEDMSAAGRLLVRSGIGAAEGGFYGAGNAVNQAVLSDHPLTAEYLLAQTGGGALLGGALSGGLTLGGDYVSKKFSAIGNEARAGILGRTLGADSKALEEAGLKTADVTDAFRSGVIQPGDTPLQVQSRVAEHLSGIKQDLQSVASKIDGSGQTFNLPQIVDSAVDREAAQPFLGIGPADEAANTGRLLDVRSSLLAHETPASQKILGAVDAAIRDKAGNIDSSLSDQLSGLLKRNDRYETLQDLADAAVSKGHVPGKVDAMGALLRNGEKIATWSMLSHLSGGLLGDRAGVSAFVGLGIGNALHEVAENPGMLGESFVKAVKGVAKVTGQAEEHLQSAISAATGKASVFGGRASGEVLKRLGLPHDATDDDVENVRRELQEGSSPVPNGNPHINQALQGVHGVLANALPPPGAPPMPRSLARPSAPDQKAIARYNETLEAVSYPLHTIAAIGKGHATSTQLQAIRAAYPNLAKRAANGLLNASASIKGMAPLALRRGIEALAGRPVDPALNPVKVARVQSIFAQAQAPGRGGQAPGGGGVKLNQKGLSEIDLGHRLNAQARIGAAGKGS